MKADGAIHPAMLAPCGICCAVCYRHLGRKPCAGCAAPGGGKPAHHGACKIRSCAGERGLSHCFECGLFPCPPVRRLDRSYRARYGASLIRNGLAAKEMGVAAFLAEHQSRYTCAACGGVISIQDKVCSECGAAYSFEEGV
ncbi:MAG TPA: DUF3795 domain-containing protein [Candidatus Acidoferrum sp.]|nr:DUF3795 domain-containing protein [Candidatus Acidoferrum sp.]